MFALNENIHGITFPKFNFRFQLGIILSLCKFWFLVATFLCHRAHPPLLKMTPPLKRPISSNHIRPEQLFYFFTFFLGIW